MDEEQEELSTHEASQKSGMSQRYLASLLRQHKLEGAYDSKRRRWTVNAAALERFLTIDDEDALTYYRTSFLPKIRAARAMKRSQAYCFESKSHWYRDYTSLIAPLCNDKLSVEQPDAY